MQAHETGEGTRRLLALDVGIVLARLEQFEVGGVAGVVLEDVHDELFLNGLPHGVSVEGLPIPTEDRQSLVFGRGGEGEEADVRLFPAFGHAAEEFLHVLQALFRGLLLRFGKQRLAGQDFLQVGRRFAGLGTVSFVNDDRHAPGGQDTLTLLAALFRQLEQLAGDKGEFLKRSDDDGHTAFQRGSKLLGILVNSLHHTLAVVELVNGVLQLLVEHQAVGDHDHAVEYPLVLCVVQR